VAVGTTATLTTDATGFTYTSETATVDRCTHSQLGLVVTQNTDAGVVAAINTGIASGCNLPWVDTTSTPWTLTVSGTGTASGTSTSWLSTIDGFTIDVLNGRDGGRITTGLTARQPTAAGAPICITAAAAGTFTGPLTSDGHFDANYCFTGTAAAWSLTN
jgi:hypothetical protein